MSIFTFGPKKVKDRNVGKINTRGKGWDSTVGGWWFDLKLVDVFADQFNAKVGMGSFRNEAQREVFFLMLVGREINWSGG